MFRAIALVTIYLSLLANAPSNANAQSKPAFRVTLLGTGNPRPTTERSGPAILVEAMTNPPTRILVDVGRGATERLFTVGGRELLSGVDMVLLTHLHSDHVVGIPDLWLTGWIFGRAKPFVVRGPSGSAAMMAHLQKAFEFDVTMRRDLDEHLPAAGVEVDAKDIESDKVIVLNGVKITPFTVDHGIVKPAYGYRIDYAGKSVVLSGDTRYSENLITHAKSCDLLIHEVVVPEVERKLSLMRSPAATQRVIEHHTTPEECGRVFTAVKPKLAVYSHIVPSPATAKDIVGPTRKTYAGPLVVGEDLMFFTVGAGVEMGQWRPGKSAPK
ncbi:MAG: MBL fold metallo-hydrolase [Chthonomonadales bacterium]